MIRNVDADEADQVFELMSKVYSNHSFLNQGIDSYKNQMENGDYVSLGYFSNETLLAHSGFRVFTNYALINALVVDPAMRGEGLGKSIFEARLDHIKNNFLFDFIIGYSVTQHLGSQKLYDQSFKAIGLEIGYTDIYHNQDSKYNNGPSSNAEIVLCKRLVDEQQSHANIKLPNGHHKFASQILHKIGVSCDFIDMKDGVDSGTDAFLGFHPDAKSGLLTPRYISKSAEIDFEPILTSNQDRKEFVDIIRDYYEK